MKAVRGAWGPSWLPLLVVLVVQAGLSVRLVGADTAFQDEATYLWAGHLEWAHVLHGTPLPPFPAYFSGAPVIYPPLGAAGGQRRRAGRAPGCCRWCSCSGATVAAVGRGGRLFGRRAAFFAAALFALSGPTLHLGAFATYDAMSLFLLALAAWLRGRGPGTAGEATGWMAAAGVLLALANATAYSIGPVRPGGDPARPAHRLAGRAAGWPPGAAATLLTVDRRAAHRGRC